MTPRLVLSVALLLSLPVAASAQKEYGFDNRKPSGQPYLSPEETVRRMKVADGFEVKLFAAEPMLVNPIAFTIDEKGRTWVVECFEYPKRTAKGQMPRDRIVVLEDTDGDGKADKRTVFAEGKDFPMPFDLASGIEVGHGGVFLGAPPYLWFLQDTNNDGKADKFEVLLKGFGSQDTHETLNTFQWGPDGWLYGLHGVFTHSEVTPGQADGPTERINAAVWRYDVRSKKFETFAEGTSNPWGMDWRNTDGQFILCCCVIPHLFHISPGGNYKRQAGTEFNPYAYGRLNEICDHTFHKESGWAHAGLISLDTPLMPPEYRDSVIFGSIHGCSIKRNVLKRNGSTFTASRADDFLVSGDKNFRPINLKWGPNGDIYLIDWHDQNPCHQAQPDSWDYARGRVYCIQKKGAATKKAEDLSGRTKDQLRDLVYDTNPYLYRTALRLLKEQLASAPAGQRLVVPNNDTHFPLTRMWANEHATIDMLRDPQARSRGIQQVVREYSGANVQDTPDYRAWVLRNTFRPEIVGRDELEGLALIAKNDQSPIVRLEILSMLRWFKKAPDVHPVLHALMQHREDAADPAIPLMLWYAYEPRLTAQPQAELDWLKANATGNPLVTDHILPRAVRRLVATGKADDLAACVAFAAAAADGAVRLKALEGLAEALKGRLVDAPPAWAAAQAKLAADANPQVQKLLRALAVNFRDPAAVQRALIVVKDAARPAEERAEAVRQLAQLKPPEALPLLLGLLKQDSVLPVRLEAARGLAGFDQPRLAQDALAGWKDYPPAVRGELVNTLAGHRAGARALIRAVAAGSVEKTALNANTVLRMRAFRDRALDAEIEKVWGIVRDTPADLTKLLTTMRAELDKGPTSFAKGKAVFDAQCAKCHQFDGRGHAVGPALDGAGRDAEYLLVNVLDPNRVVGQPYFLRRVVLKSGRIEEGLLAAEDDKTITLKGENDALKVIAKADAEAIEVVEKSVMPEGLTSAMSVQDFRDLVRYAMVHPFLADWQVAGPFPQPKVGLFTPTGPRPGAGATWEAQSTGVNGRLELPRPQTPTGYVYATTTFTTAAPVQTRLLLGARVPLRVWLDNREIYSGTPGDAARPDQASVAVELAPGTHRLLVEVKAATDREALFARFLDPDRKLQYPELGK